MNAASVKVVLWNRKSNMMLEHLNSERVEAIVYFTTDALLPSLQWHRIAHETDKGFFVFKNAETIKLLGHYSGEPMQARDEDVDNEHCQ